MTTLETTTDLSAPEEFVSSFYYFPSGIYSIRRPDFLQSVNAVSEEQLEQIKSRQGLDDIYPVHMTGNYANDPRVQEFTNFVTATAHTILANQGYLTENLSIYFAEMWTQEHHKHSLMEQHVHGQGVHMVGFYFLETPHGCSKPLFHDPRQGKVQINLPEAKMSEATYGSNIVNFSPDPGMLILTNSWLPHSFTRHASEEPVKFVHFNLGVQYVLPAPTCSTDVEIV
jgi:uncharacterized protein (TIGR02466 family)